MSDAKKDLSQSPLERQAKSEYCVECGKQVNSATRDGVCADCSLRNLLNDSFHQTADFGSQPLIDHPDKDVTIDDQGRGTLVDPFKPGECIGSFEIVRRLGRGGMGTVYEAQDTENDRRVALKVLNRTVDNESARERFLREGRLAASINHPNSVFVFGTHQIQDHSLISMELVNGGTLEQRVRRHGPLASRDAVDVALQIIDGLDAAYATGILHRDIKPANCFEGADGIVKIGDFGLSISTEPEIDARVTTEGTILGTPAFSSPEQLRGDGLDVRSDIYALGVTLYYLLTGRTPYQADSLVKLLSQVFDKSPPSPDSIRPEISQQLSQLVLQCLAKEPGDRFRSYGELRDALTPFSSDVPEAVSFGWRTAAGVIDWSVIGILGLIYAALTSYAAEPVFATSHVASRSGAVIFSLFYIVYYSVSEWAYGQTIGKKLLGLRTTQVNGDKPSFRQSVTRAAIFVLFPSLIVLPYNMLFRVGETFVVPAIDGWFFFELMIGWSHWVLLVILFSTARMRNAMAGLHDLVSQTRVVGSVIESPGHQLEVASPLVPAASEKLAFCNEIGPYQILRPFATHDSSDFYEAYDSVLLRRVWLRRVWLRSVSANEDTSSQLPARSSRVTRLRWLNRFESDGKVWDVYEALTGGPLIDRLNSQRNATQHLSRWLSDFAEEMERGLGDGSVPEPLRVQQLWLTEAGRLKVLEFDAPDAVSTTSEARTFTDRSPTERCQDLLRHLAPQVRESLTPRGSSTLPPPRYVTELLNKWEYGNDLRHSLQATRSVSVRKPVSMKRKRRLMSAACYALPLFQIVLMVAYQMLSGLFFANNDDLRQLRALVQIVQETEHCKDAWKFEELIEKQPELKTRLEPDLKSYYRYQAATHLIAGKHQGVLDDPRMNSIPALMHIFPAQRERISKVQSEAEPTEKEIQAASSLLAEPIAEKEATAGNNAFSGYGIILSLAIMSWVSYVAFPAALAGLVFRGGLVIHGFQTTIVRMDGALAGRFRIFLRAMLGIIPGFAAAFCIGLGQAGVFALGSPLLLTSLIGIAVSGAVVSNFFHQRSLADRIMGTAVVSR